MEVMMKLTTVLRAEHSGDVPLWIEAPANDEDPEADDRKRRMQDKLEWAKALLGERYVLHPRNRVTRADIPFALEKSR
jgi:hypothetical protein